MCLAVPGRVINVVGDEPLDRIGQVAFGSVVRRVNFAYVPDVAPGDYVIVHVGFAISRLDQEAADYALGLISELEQANSESFSADCPAGLPSAGEGRP
ncbi:MAG: HypC/HybG/HupF family hydrogenase formation chaperone [Proteobacteria bacterium]|nr:HypC/HybG/HupF family hydrogenase formation chaperone [Pseudomonadota bacterium]